MHYGVMNAQAILHFHIGNNISNTGSYGIRIIKYTSGYAKECIVANNVLLGCGQTITVDGIILQDGAEDNVVTGNNIISSGRSGIFIDGAYNMISSNEVFLSGQHGIRVEGTSGRSMITGNQVHQSGQNVGNTYAGIYLNSAADVTVTGNRSGDTGSGTRQKYGFQEAGSSDNNLVTGNMFDRNGTSGMLVLGANTIYSSNRV